MGVKGQSLMYRLYGSRFGDLELRVKGLGFRAQTLGFRVQGLRFEVLGLEYGVWQSSAVP